MNQGKRYKFGVQVLFGMKQAMTLDMEVENTLWLEDIKKELKCLNDPQVFTVLDSEAEAPQEYQYVPYHFVFDVKFDLRQRA